jgi:hypothetical protein
VLTSLIARQTTQASESVVTPDNSDAGLLGTGTPPSVNHVCRAARGDDAMFLRNRVSRPLLSTSVSGRPGSRDYRPLHRLPAAAPGTREPRPLSFILGLRMQLAGPQADADNGPLLLLTRTVWCLSSARLQLGNRDHATASGHAAARRSACSWQPVLGSVIPRPTARSCKPTCSTPLNLGTAALRRPTLCHSRRAPL